jgi:hypothetical protein
LQLVNVRVDESNFGTALIFEVPLYNRPPVFMSAKIDPCSNEERGIVIVEPEKFLALCRKDPYNRHRELSHGNPHTWINDKKYPEAVKGFAFGCKNPVPLASVLCETGTNTNNIGSHSLFSFGRSEHENQFHYVAFKKGITRTMWLLSKGCKAFPVECVRGARDLHRIAAVSGTSLFVADELMKMEVIQ